jgi:hypothetical protein
MAIIRFYSPFIALWKITRPFNSPTTMGIKTMIKLQGTSLEQAGKDLISLARWAPYKYGGKWFLVHIQGQTYGYRTMSAIHKRLRKLDILTFEVLQVGE